MFLSAAITGLAVENPVFARALGISSDGLLMKSRQQGIILGLSLTLMALFTSLAVAAWEGLELPTGSLRPIVYLSFACGFYLVMHYLARSPKIVGVRPMLKLSLFNTALFGAFYIPFSQGFGPAQAIGYALGSGLGYTLSLLLLISARERLSLSSVPRSFRGLPILLVYMGLVSLALYGLIGQVLPT